MNIIQIGCNTCEDSVFAFVKENASKIENFIAVDVLAKCIEIAKEKYSFLGDKARMVNTAIGNKNGLVDFFYPTSDEKSQHASLNVNHVIGHLHCKIEKRVSPCLNINDFLASLSFEEIDYFFIDVEGLDVLILLEMDLEKYHPKHLQFEYVHSDGAHSVGENLNKLIQKLKKLDYSLSRSGEYDIIAKKK